jgi:hypothetical protein
MMRAVPPGGGPPFDVPPLGKPDFPSPGAAPGGPDAFSVEMTGVKVGNCGVPGPPADCFNLDFTILSDPDPSVTIGFTATNLTNATQSFVFAVALPINPTLSGSVIANGSVSGTLTDTDSNGATFSSIGGGSAVYTALFNPSGGGSGTQVASGLFLDPFSFSVPSQASGSPMPPGAFGPSPFNVAQLDEIGIRIEFELSPGDIVGFTGNFFVVAPEPGMTLLVLSGLAVAALARRRLR